jgi:hypothetical protein
MNTRQEWASNITRIGRGRERRMRMEGNKKKGRRMDGWMEAD